MFGGLQLLVDIIDGKRRGERGEYIRVPTPRPQRNRCPGGRSNYREWFYTLHSVKFDLNKSQVR